MYKVAVTASIFPQVLEKLSRQCALKVWDKPYPIPQETLKAWLNDAEGLYSTGIPITDNLLGSAPKLLVISQASVGYDNIDIDACTARGIPVGNTPGVLVEATADLAFGLILNAARRIPDAVQFVRDGKWSKATRFPLAVDLYAKNLGIVGMGSIGLAVAKRAQASGMNIFYHNRRRRSDDRIINATYTDFEALLRHSDFVLVLAPLSNETRGMFGRAEFAKMKKSAHFINAARGAIADNDALADALSSGTIAYAALDVTDPEPPPPDHRLLILPNVMITPHIGSATAETRLAMGLLAADNLLAGLNGKPLLTCVNPSAQSK